MSVRELIQKLIQCYDLDKEIGIRIVTRDINGCVVLIKNGIPLGYISPINNFITIEQSSIDIAEPKLPD